MNIIEIISIASTLFLFLVVLGVMRETMILREQVTALSQLITKPPLPQILGGRLPDILANQISIDHTQGQPHVIIFLSTGCNGCEALISQLKQAVSKGILLKENISCVVSAHTASNTLFQSAKLISRNAILDAEGVILRECEIKGTPAQLVFKVDTLQVFDYHLGGSIEWIQQKLQQQKTLITTQVGISNHVVVNQAEESLLDGRLKLS